MTRLSFIFLLICIFITGCASNDIFNDNTIISVIEFEFITENISDTTTATLKTTKSPDTTKAPETTVIPVDPSVPSFFQSTISVSDK